jgi:hypothetical protein
VLATSSLPLGVLCAKSTFRGMKCQTKVLIKKQNQRSNKLFTGHDV